MSVRRQWEWQVYCDRCGRSGPGASDKWTAQENAEYDGWDVEDFADTGESFVTCPNCME